MKKIVTFLSFMSFSALFSQITITANLPSEISANATLEPEVKINKGTISNFAKYQMDVPPGYSVAPIDIKGGNFTFEQSGVITFLLTCYVFQLQNHVIHYEFVKFLLYFCYIIIFTLFCVCISSIIKLKQTTKTNCIITYVCA